MAIIQKGIFTLYERFPDRREAVRSLYEKNDTFRTLCEDHRKCREAIRFWQRKEGDIALQRLEEYEELIRDLEEEVSAFLKGCP